FRTAATGAYLWVPGIVLRPRRSPRSRPARSTAAGRCCPPGNRAEPTPDRAPTLDGLPMPEDDHRSADWPTGAAPPGYRHRRHRLLRFPATRLARATVAVRFQPTNRPGTPVGLRPLRWMLRSS